MSVPFNDLINTHINATLFDHLGVDITYTSPVGVVTGPFRARIYHAEKDIDQTDVELMLFKAKRPFCKYYIADVQMEEEGIVERVADGTRYTVVEGPEFTSENTQEYVQLETVK